MLTVAISGYGYGGEGFCRLEDGGFVSVPHTAIGDVVEVRIGPWRRGRAWAEIIRWVERSDDHIEPGCPYYDRCSGCALRHLSPVHERQWKLHGIGEVLGKFGPSGSADLPIAWISGSGRDHHRSRGRFAVERDGQEYRIGLTSVALDRAVVDVRDCPAQSARFVELMRRVATVVERAELDIDSISIDTVAADTGTSGSTSVSSAGSCQDCRVSFAGPAAAEASAIVGATLGDAAVAEQLLLPHGVRTPRQTWLPTNWPLQRAAVRWAIDQLPDITEATVLDLGAGCGLTTSVLANRCARVIAIDEDHLGLAAIANVGWANVETRAGRIGTILRKLRRERVRASVALIGPMRTPLGYELDELGDVGVKTAVYLGPSAASTARDLGRLAEQGFVIRALAAVDLHPGTAQVMLAAAVGEMTSS